MKASAGSGKTFNLARHYIRRLLEKPDVPDAYRHILAVTFTNKASEEMKDRILKELFILSVLPGESDFAPYFVRGGDAPDGENEPLFDSLEDLQGAASKCLHSILHDYGSFSVGTMDTFFQRILKAFSREIGHDAGYQIDLERDSLITESVDRILDSMTEADTGRVEWLTSGVLAALSEGRRTNVAGRLYEAAKDLKSVQFREAASRLRAGGRPDFDPSEAFSPERIGELEKTCKAVRVGYVAKVRAAATAALDAAMAEGLGEKELARSVWTGLEALSRLSVGGEPKVSATLGKALNKEASLFSAKYKAAEATVGQVFWDAFDGLSAVLGDAASLSEYRTACAIYDGLHDLAIASDLWREFDALKKEKNVMDLNDSDEILSGIIGGSDLPFIYEKMGVRYEDFLLDEFQDTSEIQWRNLRPLIAESQGHESNFRTRRGPEFNKPFSLIVGDVKQSIYRFRGSDWSLLARQVDADMAGHGCDVLTTTLDRNFRSLGNVVRFNNGFFRFASAWLSDEYNGSDGQDDTIARIYGDLGQKVMREGGQEGCVKVMFLPKGERLGRLLGYIEDVHSRGAAYRDIAVLVRTNGMGAEVAAYLIGQGLKVVSDDSLLVKSSPVVRDVVACLSLLHNPHDAVSRFQAGEAAAVPPEGCNSIIDECGFFLRRIEALRPGSLARDTLYVQSFMDFVSDYVSTGGNNLGGLLQKWKDYSGHIASPEGDDAVRVLTIHKSKGLEFPCVICYYEMGRPGQELSFRSDFTVWATPDGGGGSLPGTDGGLFKVSPSGGKLAGTAFEGAAERERLLLYIDVINTFYVAFTRAKCELCVIADVDVGSQTRKPYSTSDFRSCLHRFVSGGNGFEASSGDGSEAYAYGCPFDFGKDREEERERKEAEEKVRNRGGKRKEDLFLRAEPLDYAFLSKELPAGTLKSGKEPLDFFSDDGAVGIDASERRLGIAMHDILGRVEVPSDLDGAVDEALLQGILTASQAEKYRGFLRGRIAEVSPRGWFPDDRSLVDNERAVFDGEGGKHRPDRVVRLAASTVIIDYKFTAEDNAGRPPARYLRQVRRYMELYRSLGFPDVQGFLWFVSSGRVFEVR